MIKTRTFGAIALSLIPYITNADWTANMELIGYSTNATHIESTRFGVKNGASIGFDSFDKIDPPALPNEMNTYQENSSVYPLAANYIGTNDVPFFKGVIEYNGTHPVLLFANFSGLPNDNYVFLSFTNNNYTSRNQAMRISNKEGIGLTNTQSYIITESPIINDFKVDISRNEYIMNGKFNSDGKVPSLNVLGSSSVNLPITNLVGKLNYVNNGEYVGTNDLPLDIRFFRLEVGHK